ncbi:MAG: capsular polysaccharide synthesis protein [Lachnospiraceae bacterium]|nr:capsular polysaccharide synthesis protein [Lachnospiraceae bacterium]
MTQITEKDIIAIKKRTELLQRLFDLLLSDLLTLYRNGNQLELNPGEKQCELPGPIPVWFIWWQGPKRMPPLVRACLSSLKRALPEDITSLHLITSWNIGQYVTLPSWIKEKASAGKIDPTHLSDIVRMSLLDNYGGLYTDATFYFTEAINRPLLTDRDFFTLCDRKKDWYDLVRGRWSCNFFYKRTDPYGGSSDHTKTFFHFIKNALYLYWAKEDKLQDYYIFDYMIDSAYRNLPGVREIFDSLPDTNPKVADMVFALNDSYSQKRLLEFTADTRIFKLSNKIPLMETTADGKPTLYSWLINRQ